MSDTTSTTAQTATGSTSDGTTASDTSLVFGQFKDIGAAEKAYKETKAAFTKVTQELAELKKGANKAPATESATSSTESAPASSPEGNYKGITDKVVAEIKEKGVEGLTEDTIKEALSTGLFGTPEEFKEYVQIK